MGRGKRKQQQWTPVAEVQPPYDAKSGAESVISQWVEALVDCPGAQGLYTYAVPPPLTVQAGDILSVPFGTQQVGAIAVRCLSSPAAELDWAQIRPIEDVVSHRFFPPDYWILLHQVADYYCTPLMQVVRVALPPGLLRRSQRRIRQVSGKSVPSEQRMEVNQQEFDPNPDIDHLTPVTSSAQSLLDVLANSKTGDLTWHYLRQQVRGSAAGLRELLRLGLVESYLEMPSPVRPKLQQAVMLTSVPIDVTLSVRQQEVLEVLKRRGGDLWLTELLQSCRVSTSVVKTLEKKGYVVIQQRELLRSETGQPLAADQPKVLNEAQGNAVHTITHLTGFAQVLLHGVTGSGKTEVYLQTIAHILRQRKSALVLVPEIGLTPQLTDRIRQRFCTTNTPILIYHSGLSDGERYDTWRQMLQPHPQIVIGTRSAIFAPLPNLGIIVLDEEHDDSFKQDQPAPCYHARTVAQWRATLADCPLVLGSATPSLESWTACCLGSLVGHQSSLAGHLHADRDLSLSVPAVLGHSSLDNEEQIANDEGQITNDEGQIFLSLPERIHDRPLPPISVVDMRQELQQGNRSIFSRSLQDALIDLQERRQQGILFIHRRGHSTFVSCRNCGYVLECPHCDVSLAYHHVQEGASQLLRCHYCNFTQLHPPHCPQCSSPYLKHFGSGTQRVMQELARELPELRCLRYDSDTTRTKGAHRALMSRFVEGEVDVLVGTQMLTKGLDLPQVTLVGVIAADGLLHLADYRASERSYQTLTQVAGRSGRGSDPGQVIIQTYNPEHPVIQAVQRQDYAAFVATELQLRQAFHYPPTARLILLRLSSPDAGAVETTARRVAEALQQRAANLHDCQVLGPAPAPILRIANRYRWQILLKQWAGDPEMSRDRPTKAFPMLLEVETLRSLCPSAVSLTIDIDPLYLS